MIVFLIGFMGVGKSHIGKQLADYIHYSFLDTDTMIETQVGMSISEIFAQRGESVFRQIEQEVLRSIIKDDNLVVACGGGMPCYEDNMDWMLSHGVVVYIKLSNQAIISRLNNQLEANKRPLIDSKTRETLTQWVPDTVIKRECYYARAQYIIDGELQGYKEIADIIFS